MQRQALRERFQFFKLQNLFRVCPALEYFKKHIYGPSWLASKHSQ
jgi:hypothetical protein